MYHGMYAPGHVCIRAYVHQDMYSPGYICIKTCMYQDIYVPGHVYIRTCMHLVTSLNSFGTKELNLSYTLIYIRQ